MNSFKEEKKTLAYYMRRLYKTGLTTSLGGNISSKVNDYILLTPSAIDKGKLSKKQIVVLDKSGKNLTQGYKPSCEVLIHLKIYKNYPEVKAIVHAHPPISSVFSAMKTNINTRLLAESHFNIGEALKIPYNRQGTEELSNAVANGLKMSNVIIMQNHGIITVGKSLVEAFERVEALESAAKATIITKILNDKIELSDEEIHYLDNL